MARTFEGTLAKDSQMQMPLTIGVIAPSSQGKTCGAVRLARGIQRVFKGPIVGYDTEGGRMLEHAKALAPDMIYRPFYEPYGSLDYCAALDDSLQYRPSCVIIDSLSHEHEGIGGYSDIADSELARGLKAPGCYKKGAGLRRKLLSKLLTFPCTVILCMRAEPKRDWEHVLNKTARDPVQLGYCPVGGAEFVYQMTARFLLLPEVPDSPMKGAPVWESRFPGEIATMKRGPFKDVFAQRHQLCEADGEAMARWAAGMRGASEQMSEAFSEALSKIAAALTADELNELGSKFGENSSLADGEKKALRRSFAARKRELEQAESDAIAAKAAADEKEYHQ